MTSLPFHQHYTDDETLANRSRTPEIGVPDRITRVPQNYGMEPGTLCRADPRYVTTYLLETYSSPGANDRE